MSNSNLRRLKIKNVRLLQMDSYTACRIFISNSNFTLSKPSAVLPSRMKPCKDDYWCLCSKLETPRVASSLRIQVSFSWQAVWILIHFTAHCSVSHFSGRRQATRERQQYYRDHAYHDRSAAYYASHFPAPSNTARSPASPWSSSVPSGLSFSCLVSLSFVLCSPSIFIVRALGLEICICIYLSISWVKNNFEF